MPQPGQPSRRKRFLFTLLLIVLVPLGAFVLFEGGSSALLLASDVLTATHMPPERKYSEYDSLLGWVSTPNTVIKDMYGPGNDLTINAQGIRSTTVIASRVPPGRVRTICSGDSFALGFGVDDGKGWCERLSVLEPRLEPVNMGQAAYGLDQAYLWYQRDGIRFDPDLHIVSFIWAVIGRISETHFAGYPKPVLVTRNDTLQVTNVPVPPQAYSSPVLTSWIRNSRLALRPLRSFELGRRVRAILTDREAVLASGDSAILATAGLIVEELARINEKRGTTMVLVHLPAEDDGAYPAHGLWNRGLRTLADRLGVLYLDLGEDLRRLSPDSLRQIYIPDDGHYTELGNAWVAERVLAHMKAFPATAALLAGERRPAASQRRTDVSAKR